MARKTGREAKRGRSRTGAKRRGRAPRRGFLEIGLEKFKATVTTVALLATGALVASWWIAWREAEIAEAPNAEAAAVQPVRRMKVEVLNGSGEPGAAAVIGDLLLEFDYDVVTVDNADNFDYPVTYVIDRSGVGGPVTEMARRIGADSVALDPDPDLFLDATVILGRDWRALNPGG
ncbi:MAG: LytR C-terminal domain-containing protein [Gemmatimonadota bacterium]